MTTTPLWSIPEVAPSQDQKETTINNALVWLEGALADEYDGITWTSNACTLGNNAFTQHLTFKCPDNAAAASTLTVPLLKKFFVVNNALGSHQVTVKGATGATVVVPNATVAILLCDGADIFTTTALAATSGVLSLGGASGAIGVTGNIAVAGSTLTLSGMAAESIPAEGAIYSTGTHIAHLTLSADFVLAGGSLSLTGVEYTANKNVSNGYAGLDSGGRIAFAQLPTSLGEAWYPAGTWNAATNSPTLASSTAPTGARAGAVYVVSVAGTTSLDGYAVWNVGDKALWDGTSWERIEGDSTEVTSVAGRTGAVTLTTSDIAGLNGIASQTVPSSALVYSNGTILVAATAAGSLAFSGGTLAIASQATHTLFGNPGTASASPGVVPLGTSMSLASGTLEIAPIASHTVLANTGTVSATPAAVPLSSHLTLSGGTLDLVNYGSANGIAGLDANGYVPFAQMQPEVQNLPFAISHPGTMSDSEVLLVIPVNQTLTIPAGLTGTYVILNDDTADVPAATTALIYASKHAGAWTNRGTLSVSTAGSLTITGSPTADVTLVPGDGVRITGQATHDTGFKNFGVVTMLKKVAG